MDYKIEITRDQYTEFLTEHTLLRVLLINGVENWEKFDDSLEQAKKIIKDALNNQETKGEQQ